MIDLIVVVFREELSLLQIQAKSINQYVNLQDINSISIIVNDTNDVAELIDPSWWGQFSQKIKIKPRSQFRYTDRVNGWESQQLLKLLAASEADSTWSMVLDSKTWFIRDLNANALFDNQQRACTGIIGIFPQFVDSKQFVEQYYNIKFDHTLGPGGVPFIFHTLTVIDMINSVNDFPDFFQTALRFPNLTTEFYFYSGYVLAHHKTYNTLYSNTQTYNCLNLAEWQVDDFDHSIKSLQADPCMLTASIHRKTYTKLTQEQILTWVLFLKDRKVIHDISNTVNLINTYIE